MPERLTVGELRKLIDALPEDMPVSTEGCDCTGPSDGVTVNNQVLCINRNDALPLLPAD